MLFWDNVGWRQRQNSSLFLAQRNSRSCYRILQQGMRSRNHFTLLQKNPTGRDSEHSGSGTGTPLNSRLIISEEPCSMTKSLTESVSHFARWYQRFWMLRIRQRMLRTMTPGLMMFAAWYMKFSALMLLQCLVLSRRRLPNPDVRFSKDRNISAWREIELPGGTSVSLWPPWCRSVGEVV